ncbi:hypothetical protein [Micromonospora halophytica]|uniref:DegT/DnrJ/EryC1/StrS aminotransferase family protein n=1 Tax=Micromonospora halophytica TaxID=47864 RepID=A0A1C5ISD8_9ACTN|nr:hypothetical protein [Micromonospora halophytica]SCG60911.1 hypothetical protein GA0070560_11598 [Micromonospora halophytica]
MTPGTRWEVGSSFPLWTGAGAGWTDDPRPMRLYGNGRQALAALLRFGHEVHGWDRVHVPAYYCPPVVRALSTVVPVSRYEAGPHGPVVRPDPGPGEVVLAVSFFGRPPVLPVGPGAGLIVDATHDPLAPWLPDLCPDFVVAALRKTLPVPDGGALWSPRGRGLPPQPLEDDRHLAAVATIVSAMAMKSAYLAHAGGAAEKERYLARYAAGEKELGRSRPCAASPHTRYLLDRLPVHDMRRKRLRNTEVLARGLTGIAGVTVSADPYGVILLFDSAQRREAVRRGLLSARIYPAVLWPMDDADAPERFVAYSRRMLHLHTDFRWGPEDMTRVAAAVRRLVPAGRDTGSDRTEVPPMRGSAPTRAASAATKEAPC